jgi:hypothetical protein
VRVGTTTAHLDAFGREAGHVGRDGHRADGAGAGGQEQLPEVVAVVPAVAGDQVLGLRHGRGEGLLDQHMPAGSERLGGEPMVEPVGRGDDHRLDRRCAHSQRGRAGRDRACASCTRSPSPADGTNPKDRWGRLIEDRSGQPVLLAFLYHDEGRQFLGELSDPCRSAGRTMS